MKVSHILYKVNNLEEAVKEYEKNGFVVEYGKSKNPYNALVYFSDGPYLELFETSGMPKLIKLVLKLFNKSFVERINFWENAEEGLIAVCLENYKTNLLEETNILKKHGHKFFQIKTKRKDTKDRLLKFICVFPNETKIPFFMTYFSIDPKPKDFVHPNGVKSISSISFGTTEKLIPIINELCDDPILKLYIGDGVKDMVYEKN
ncbi:MAG: VOC family protein [Alkaliphilus sp.]